MRSTTALRDEDAIQSSHVITAKSRTTSSLVPFRQSARNCDLGATTKVRRRVATVQVSDARNLGPSALFSAVTQALATLDTDTKIDAVVLRGRRLFAMDGMALDRADPAARAALRAVSNCAWPVVAAIEGSAAGVGLELALACAARVARDGDTFSFPGVKFGRLPIHGGARRLPLLVSHSEAARMLVFGEAVSGREAMGIGLVDALNLEDVERFARDRVHGRCDAARRHPSEAERTAAEAVLLGVAQRLKRERPGEAAPLAVLRAMEAAIGVSEAEAMAEAARLDEKLSKSHEADALLHATLGARTLDAAMAGEAARLAGLTDRAFWPLLREAIHLLDEGATPSQVDRCLTAYGFAAGPFARSDEVRFSSVVNGRSPHWHSYSPTLDLMTDAGRLIGGGQGGWYQPRHGAAVFRSDPFVERLLDGSAVSQRLIRRPIPDEVIVRRCLNAAVNGTAALAEGAHDLDAGLLDAIWTTRLGFPRWKGGPLFQGAFVGHGAVVAELETSRRRRDTAGAPSPALARLLGALA